MRQLYARRAAEARVFVVATAVFAAAASFAPSASVAADTSAGPVAPVSPATSAPATEMASATVAAASTASNDVALGSWSAGTKTTPTPTTSPAPHAGLPAAGEPSAGASAFERASAFAILGLADKRATLEAIRFTLNEVADGATFVWRRQHGFLRGVVRPVSSFRDTDGRICRNIILGLAIGATRHEIEGVACREKTGNWTL